MNLHPRFRLDPRVSEAIAQAEAVHDTYLEKFPYDTTSAGYLADDDLTRSINRLRREGVHVPPGLRLVR